MFTNSLDQDFTIIKDASFDPMDILAKSKNGDGKVIYTADDDDKDDDKDDKDKNLDDFNKAPVGKQTNKVPEIELSDDDLIAGLQKAKVADSKSTVIAKKSEQDDVDDDDDDVEDDKPKLSVKIDANNAVALHYKMMVESGDWKEIEGFDGSDEMYEEAKTLNLTEQANGLANNYFNEAFKQNPEGKDKGVKLFNWLRAGGTITDFIDVNAPAEFPFEDLENTDEEVSVPAAKDLLRNYYGSIGWKKEKIENKIVNLGKLGLLIDEAKDVKEPYQEMIEEQQAREEDDLRVQKAQNQALLKKNNTEIKRLIEENPAFGGEPLYASKKEKQEIEQYLFQTDEETGKTLFNQEINQAFKDPKFILFAANAYRKKLHEKPVETDKAKDQKATSKLRSTLEGALLNKKIVTDKNIESGAGKSGKSNYTFDLDQAIVIQ